MREIELRQYLPPFMQSCRQMSAALEEENKEFNALWSSADEVLKNRFILSADEQGVEHFERLLGIIPGKGDTLESRRAFVQSRWFNKLPYTLRILSERLTQALGGDYKFELNVDFSKTYTVRLTVHTTNDSENDNLKYILETLVPVNMMIDIIYEGVLEGTSYYGAVLQTAEIMTIRQRRR